MSEATKLCTKCKDEFPATLEYFFREKKNKNGLSSWCKKCKSKQKRPVRDRSKQKEYFATAQGKLAQRKSDLRCSYGITLEQYDEMFEQQNGVCKICGEINQSGRRLAVDHDHKTGKIRGLLCISCNTKFAWYEKFETEIKLYSGENI